MLMEADAVPVKDDWLDAISRLVPSVPSQQPLPSPSAPSPSPSPSPDDFWIKGSIAWKVSNKESCPALLLPTKEAMWKHGWDDCKCRTKRVYFNHVEPTVYTEICRAYQTMRNNDTHIYALSHCIAFVYFASMGKTTPTLPRTTLN